MTCKHSHGDAYPFQQFRTDVPQRIFLTFPFSHISIKVPLSSCVLRCRVLCSGCRCQHDLRRDLQQHLTSRSRLPCSRILVLLWPTRWARPHGWKCKCIITTQFSYKLTIAKLDSFYSLIYSSNTPTDWIEHIAKIGASQEWLAADRMAEYGNSYITNSTREQWKSITRAQGGVEAAQRWYKALLRGINSEDEDEVRSMPGIIERPSLFIGAERDPVGLPARQLMATLPYAPRMQVRSVDSGHFLHIEQADEVNEHLYEFFQSLWEYVSPQWERKTHDVKMYCGQV